MFINSKTGCIAVGTAGKAAEFSKVGEKQTPTLKFAIAANKDENSKTIWMNCQAWGKIAEIWDKRISKGDIITVYGKIQTREYNEKTYITLIAENILKTDLGLNNEENLSKNNSPKAKKANNNDSPTTPAFEIGDSEEELPF